VVKGKVEKAFIIVVVVFHPLADDEYWFESEYYIKLNQELGDKFSHSVNEVIDGVAHNPFLCHNRGNGIYSVRVKGFPISLFYKVLVDKIFILSVCHERRDPKIWRNRK